MFIYTYKDYFKSAYPYKRYYSLKSSNNKDNKTYYTYNVYKLTNLFKRYYIR